MCTGLAGATGIMGTFLFTRLRKWLGLERTGVIAFMAEVSCLTLAVASVWAPGSPFDPHFASSSATVASTPTVVCNLTASGSNMSVSNVTVTPCDSSSDVPSVNISVILLLVGIISSRVGE